MNFTESFQEFSSRLSPMDLALYGGVGLVLWVLFKDKLSPVQVFLGNLLSKFKGSVPSPSVVPIVVPSVDSVVVPKIVGNQPDDTFFKLVVSWKQTRDLAVQSGCAEAVKVADQMFPFLSPNVCKKNEDKVS
jgi:hypothetical protein